MLSDGRSARPRSPASEDGARLTGQDDVSPREFLSSNGILWRNPPEHTRLRRLVNKAFTPAVVQALRPEIESLVDELLDASEGFGRMDVIADLAYPLPVRVISQLLGLPREDFDMFRAWSRDLVGAFDPARGPDAVERGNSAIAAFMGYFSDLIAERRARPRDDLLSALITARDAGDALSEDELLANVIFLFVAGHETTVGLIEAEIAIEPLLRRRPGLRLAVDRDELEWRPTPGFRRLVTLPSPGSQPSNRLDDEREAVHLAHDDLVTGARAATAAGAPDLTHDADLSLRHAVARHDRAPPDERLRADLGLPTLRPAHDQDRLRELPRRTDSDGDPAPRLLEDEDRQEKSDQKPHLGLAVQQLHGS
jgi:hypothetical protein